MSKFLCCTVGWYERKSLFLGPDGHLSGDKALDFMNHLKEKVHVCKYACMQLYRYAVCKYESMQSKTPRGGSFKP